MITLGRVAELSEADREDVGGLTMAVYPPDEAASRSGQDLEWSLPDWCARVRDTAGKLVSYIGIYLRDATLDGQPVRIGGIGNVKTHPQSRNGGCASAAIKATTEFFQQQPDLKFALLVCKPELLGFYARLGWREFTGTLLVRQFTKPGEFTVFRVMTIGIQSAGPVDGIIDLNGPPW